MEVLHRRVTYTPGHPFRVRQLLLPFRRGAGDPSFRLEADGVIWRASRTPLGSVTYAVRQSGGTATVDAWGEGADWLATQVPGLLGAHDHPEDFPAQQHPVTARLWREYDYVRFPASGLVFEALLAAILEQKVTGKQAFGSWREMLRAHRVEAPPTPGPQLLLPPSPQWVAEQPSWEWLKWGVEPAASKRAVAVARRASSLQRLVDGVPPATASPRLDEALRSLPGVGVWTSAEVRARVVADADAVSFGDYHVAKNIGWAMTGTPMDDAALARWLEPFRPHRARVQALVSIAGLNRPRRGPRMSLPRHLPTRQ